MQAIIRQGGKQYIVQEGTTLTVSKINSDTKEIKPEVLAIYDEKSINLGTPVVDQAEVVAEIIGEKQGPKLHIYKYKNKNKYRRKTGHRDQLSVLKIKSIKL
ncbi:MAG TPA: 50S ribosomal protein L21 [bacterium]|nr:50S ribosomal protein L21 [bacterium]HPN67273.1 50S ribosomal protein L21 [bacterium]